MTKNIRILPVKMLYHDILADIRNKKIVGFYQQDNKNEITNTILFDDGSCINFHEFVYIKIKKEHQ